MERSYKLLVIDDDQTVCASLKLLLARRGGYEVKTLGLPNVAMETIDEFRPDLILLDMNFTIDTSGKQGLRLLEMIRSSHPEVSVILMTGWATVQLAVKGMKMGAKDFVAKPWDNQYLLDSIKTILDLYHKDGTNAPTKESDNGSRIIGNSEALQDVLQLVRKIAPTDASVLITGESGTGKELIAEAIHLNSKRTSQNFVKVNLGGISSDLFESEMFGHKRGSFTGAHQDREGRFAIAHKGTIFLDEIGELSLDNQVKLLRVLQERTFEMLGSSQSQKTDVRVVSATNRNLEHMSIQGDFREDLLYRLNLIHIHLPPLRERPDDIPLLIRHFLSNLSEVYDSDIPYIDDESMRWLSAQEYKGNIRQLKNIVERTYLMNLGANKLTRKQFEPAFSSRANMPDGKNELNLQNLEIKTIQKALARHDHSISATARALGITRSALYRRLEKYNIAHEPKI